MSVVTTEYATALSSTTMSLTGTLDSMEGQASLDVWFEWGGTTAYGNSTTPVAMTATGLASADITTAGMTPFHTAGTVYHYTIKATDGVTTWTGADRRFVFIGDFINEPYVIDNEMSSGALTGLSVYDNILLLDYYHGLYTDPEITGLAITGGTKTVAMAGPEITGLAITGGTITT